MKLKTLLVMALLGLSQSVFALTYHSGVAAEPESGSVSVPGDDNDGYYSSADNRATASIVRPFPIEPHYHPYGMHWADMVIGMSIPARAVVGGSQPEQPYTEYVCRGSYNNGMHPGKLLAGYCNISWGGQEIRLTRYQVLTSRKPLVWLSAANGRVPSNAVAGGEEEGNPLYICQADWRGGTHVGKLVGQRCHFGWGGAEIMRSTYRVLTAG